MARFGWLLGCVQLFPVGHTYWFVSASSGQILGCVQLYPVSSWVVSTASSGELLACFPEIFARRWQELFLSTKIFLATCAGNPGCSARFYPPDWPGRLCFGCRLCLRCVCSAQCSVFFFSSGPGVKTELGRRGEAWPARVNSPWPNRYYSARVPSQHFCKSHEQDPVQKAKYRLCNSTYHES